MASRATTNRLHIPDAQTKHAIEPIENSRAPLFVTVNDYLGIGACAERMAALLEIGAQFLEIINLAVKDDPDRFFGIRHRLVASRQINDGKPPEAESERSGDQIALIVRSAMPNRFGHLPDRIRFHRFAPSEVKLAANAAHA